MKWITNIYDPSKKDAKKFLQRSIRETPEEAWRRHLQWLEGKTIGEPMPSDYYTVEQMKAQGLVGVYVEDES